MDYAYALLDKGYIPDAVLRPTIRSLCRQRQKEIDRGEGFVRIQLILGTFASNHAAKMEFINDLYNRPIAIEQEKANEQHYEVPTEFLKLCLGPRMKYSSCEWPSAKSSLSDAEDTILASYCVEAKLGRGLRGVGVPKGQEDGEGVGKEGEGLKILDLGCGWGSLGLFLAEVGNWKRRNDIDADDSTTLLRRLLCCPIQRHRRFTSTLLQRRRVLGMSPSSRGMSTRLTLRRRSGEWSGSILQATHIPNPNTPVFCSSAL